MISRYVEPVPHSIIHSARPYGASWHLAHGRNARDRRSGQRAPGLTDESGWRLLHDPHRGSGCDIRRAEGYGMADMKCLACGAELREGSFGDNRVVARCDACKRPVCTRCLGSPFVQCVECGRRFCAHCMSAMVGYRRCSCGAMIACSECVESRGMSQTPCGGCGTVPFVVTRD